MDTQNTLIALNAPEVVSLLITYGRHIAACLPNQYVTTTNPPVATLSKDLDTLLATEVTAQSGAKGSAAARNAAKKVVKDDLRGIQSSVQLIANQNPTIATIIIELSGMTPKRTPQFSKPTLAARMGKVPGQILLRAKAVARGASYEWQFSPDGGKTWVAMGTTTIANTSVLGMMPGTTYLFRFRATVRTETMDWVQPLSFFAH